MGTKVCRTARGLWILPRRDCNGAASDPEASAAGQVVRRNAHVPHTVSVLQPAQAVRTAKYGSFDVWRNCTCRADKRRRAHTAGIDELGRCLEVAVAVEPVVSERSQNFHTRRADDQVALASRDVEKRVQINERTG